MTSDVVRWIKIETKLDNTTTKEFYNKNNNMNKIKCSNSSLTTSNCSSNKCSTGSFMAMKLSSFLCKLIFLLFVIKLNLVLVLCDEIMDAPGARGHYTPTWAVHIEGDSEMADAVAREHGFVNLGQV